MSKDGDLYNIYYTTLLNLAHQNGGELQVDFDDDIEGELEAMLTVCHEEKKVKVAYRVSKITESKVEQA